MTPRQDMTVVGRFAPEHGPSGGCGKTTLLHILGGFETATTGRVKVDGMVVTSARRDRGVVFQDATLFSWRTIRDTVAWPMDVDGTPRRRADG